MDDKIMEYPCTNKCLVYAACSEPCMVYRNYVEEAFREEKYKCFKIIPDPPLQIKELAILMNKGETDHLGCNYYPASDLLIIHCGREGGRVPTSIISRIRKRNTIKTAKNFPEELK